MDPSICTNASAPSGTDIRIVLALITLVGLLGTALITLLQTVILERIRQKQTRIAQQQLPARIADVIEARVESGRTSPMPMHERTTPRDRPDKKETPP